MDRTRIIPGWLLLILIGVSACAPLSKPTAIIIELTPVPTELVTASSTIQDTPTLTEIIPLTGPLVTPPDTVPEAEKPVNDVESSAASAPYGDSYRINRFERPFEQDMTYVPDLDIISFGLSEDDDWYYISITLNGNDPNNSLEIHYGAEIDLNADGFGDYIVWARPPYTTKWNTESIQVFEDGDRDTAGLSSRQSDAVFDGNGYETLLFDGGTDQNPDPNLAWVRMLEPAPATIQFALKKSWLGNSFLVGVISDAGLRDLSKYDYSDRFTEADAGSPVSNNPYYPLGSLYAVDNTCWQAHRFENLAYQPKFCPAEVLPTATGRPSSNLQPTLTVPTLSSTIPPSTGTERPSATNTNSPLATNTDVPPVTITNLPIPTNTKPPPATNTSPPPPTNTNPPPPPPHPDDTACTPDFDPDDCEFGYDPEICQCNGG